MKKTHLLTKISLAVFFTLLSYFPVKAQADVWFLGNNISIDFSSGTAVVGTGIVIGGDLTEGSTSITDANGNLLFAVVGDNVYDGGKNSVRSLGNGTWDVAQGSMIIPVPGTTNQYYLTVMKNGSGASTKPMAEYYTITANGTGAGNLTIAGPANLAPNLTQSQTGVPKLNPDGSLSTDYWYISHELCNNNFKVFSADASGINFSHNSSAGPSFDCISTFPPKYDDIGTLKFNGCYTQATYVMGDKVMLFDFDAKTGQFTHVATRTTGLSSAYSMEFSPDGNYAYILTGQDNNNPGRLYSMTVSPTGFGPPVDLGTTGGMRGGHLQLGPDGNIYFAAPQSYGNLGTGYIGRITSPNTGGVVDKTWYKAAAENNNTAAIEGQAVNMDMPNFLKSLVVASPKLLVDGVELSQTSVCQGDQVTLTVEVSGAQVASVDWVATGANTGNQSGSATFNMTMTNSGTTNVTATITDECGRQRDQDFIIEVEPYQNADGTIDACPSRVVNGTGSTTGNYAWYTADPTSGGTLLGYGPAYDAAGRTNIWVQPAGTVTTNLVTDTRSPQGYGNASGNTTVSLTSGSGAITSFDIGYYSNYPAITGSFTVELRDGSNNLVGTPVTANVNQPQGGGSGTASFSPTDWLLSAGSNYSIVVTSAPAGGSTGTLTTNSYSSLGITFTGGRATGINVINYEEAGKPKCFNGKLIPIPDCCTQLPPTVSGADTVCVGGTVTLRATPDGATSGPITYQWYSDAGLIPGATSATYVVPAAAALASTEFWATVTSSASCSGESPISNKIRVMINPNPTTPTITISPNQTSFCENEAHDLTAASTVSAGSVTYTWSNAVTGNTAQVNGVTSPAGSYTYKVVADAAGCKDSVEQVITVNPLDSAELTVDTISSCSNQGNIDLNTYKTAGTSAGTFSGTSVSGTDFNTAVAAGVYKVVYTTSGSCPESDSLYVRIVDQEEAQIALTDTTVCFGSASFTVRLTPTSVTDGTWSGTGVTAGTFDPNGLAAGAYQIKYVKQGLSASCSDSDSVTITIQALDSALISKPLPSLCSTDPSAQLNLGSGATAGGTWTDSLGTNTYVSAGGVFDPTGLADGLYKVIYTTPNTCVAKDSGYVTVTSNISYQPQASQQTTYCKNYGLDTLDVDVAGGEIWTKSGNGVVSASERIFNTNLMAVGTDTLWYGKAGACGDTIAYEITINPIDTAVIDSVSPLCEDTTAITLTITGSATGGTWAGNGVSGDQFTASTAGVGVHRITYTTAGSCPIVDTTWIEVKERKDATITADTVAFCGSAQAATMSSAQGGGTWSGWAGKWSTQGSDTLILFDPNANANSGTEDLIYTIADQWCPNADTVSVSVTAMEIAEIDSIAAICVDGDSVQFALTALSTTGGTWEGVGINPTTGYFNPAVAGAGTHEIKYQSPGGCFARDSVSIQVNPRAVADLDQSLITGVCEGAAVQTVTGTDGGGSWIALGASVLGTYATSNDKVLSFDPSSSQAGVFAYSYSIATSGTICGDTDTVAINITAIDIADITGKGLFCQSDGASAMTLSTNSTTGGTWSGTGIDPTTGVFDPNAAGVTTGTTTNKITYTTNGTCPTSDEIDVAVVAQVVIDIDLANSDTAFCGNETGKFVRLTAGSTPSASVPWVSEPAGFVDGVSGEIDVAAAVAAGHNSLAISYVINDPSGGTCRDGDTVTVRIKPVPTATITGAPTQNLCRYDGDYTGFSSTGTAGGTWSITSGGVIDASTGAVTIGAAPAGVTTTYNVSYSVTVDGCTATSSALSLTVEDSVDSRISTAQPIEYCENIAAQLISAYQDGGVWTTTATAGGVLQAGSSSKETLFDPVLAGQGSYTVTYTQAQTCTTSTTVEVNVVGVPTISIDTIVDTYCEPAEVTFVDASSSEANVSVWTFSDGTSQSTLDTVRKTFMAGCYDVTLDQQFTNGCNATSVEYGLICIDARPTPDFEWEPVRPSVVDPNITFLNKSEGASGYLWDFGRIASPTSSTESNPYVNFASENGDTVQICLTAYNGTCAADTCKDVVILNNVSIYIPTSFTPNGDGLNDFFYPNGKFHDNSEGLDQFEFIVFNRWGEQVFSSNVPYLPWDGTYRNKLVPQDVYVWKITVWDPVNQRPKTEIGTVTVVH